MNDTTMPYQYFRSANDFLQHNNWSKRTKLVVADYHFELTKLIQRGNRKNNPKRLDDFDLTFVLYDFASYILSGECRHAVLCVLLATGMIPLLIEIDVIIRCEKNFRPYKLGLVQRLILTILSPTQLGTYTTCIDTIDSKIVHDWELMLDRMRADRPPPLLACFAKKTSIQDCHAHKYHDHCGTTLECNHPHICSGVYLS